MTMVVGVASDGSGRAVLHLAATLARSAEDDLVLCSVVPAPWPPSPARVDAEYRAYLDTTAGDALKHARAHLPEDVPATTVVHHARSVPAGLLDVAEEHEAGLVVVGSSSSGVLGRVTLGSVAGRLVHSSHTPVAMAPRGYRCKPEARVTRATAAYGGSEGADDLVVGAAGVAARVGVPLRIASFVVRARPPYTSGVGREADDAMVRQWVDEIGAAGRSALEDVEELPAVPPALEATVGYGESWEEALEDVEWRDGEVLVVGSSRMGPIARVFLGSHASKIVRNAPVPVIVVPRRAAAELADQAEQPE